MLRHIFWDIGFLKDKEILRSPQFGMNKESKTVKYPIRLLRYWFMYHFLCMERDIKKRPLAVCEVGVDTGQMLRLMHAAGQYTTIQYNTNRDIFSDWIAVDCNVQKESLIEAGYSDFIESNIEIDDFSLPKQCDVMILLHVLEHLYDPEKVFENLVRHIVDGGIVIGGMPVVPHFLASYYENKIRLKSVHGGHVSVFSPKIIKEIAKKNKLKMEFITGAYFMRKRGFVLENFGWWMKLNLIFGALFPSCGSEIYWMMRK